MYKYITLITIIAMHSLSGTLAIGTVTRQTKQLKSNHLIMTIVAVGTSVINTIYLVNKIKKRAYR